MKKLFQFKLKILTKLILKKYKPRVVSITGSVGKTTTKDAVYAVLSKNFNCRSSFKNFNNEFGVPLTVLGIEDAPGRSIWDWLLVFIRGCKLLLLKDKEYPELLILEMGVDKPGDMAYLTSFIKPDIAIVTSVSQSHLEFFKKIENIQQEKAVLVQNVKKTGTTILNYDNVYSRDMSNLSKAEVFSYGLKTGASLQAQELMFNFQRFRDDESSLEKIRGISFKLNYQGAVIPARLPLLTSFTAVYGALAGALAGLSLGMNLVDVAQALESFRMPAGRMNIISGIKDTFLIDDTYNASPESTKLALKLIQQMKFSGPMRKLVVLGDMLELGSYTEEGHREVGHMIADHNMDMIIAVGEKSRDIIRGAIDKGFPKDKTFYFNKSDDAGRFLQEKLQVNDLVLIKGSQGVRMERVVKEVMAEPLKAEELLVRQEKSWL